MPRFLGLVHLYVSAQWLRGVVGATRKDARTAESVFLTTMPHLLRVETQTVVPLTHSGAKTMTHVTQGQTTPTTPAASATPHHDANQQAAPLDLHAMYRQQATCGYTRSLLLVPYTMQSISARLRGISAIGAVLTAATDEESLAISGWMRGGLVDAVRYLAADAYADLEHANERAAALEGGAA